jgi:hypothetical protein
MPEDRLRNSHPTLLQLRQLRRCHLTPPLQPGFFPNFHTRACVLYCDLRLLRPSLFSVKAALRYVQKNGRSSSARTILSPRACVLFLSLRRSSSFWHPSGILPNSNSRQPAHVTPLADFLAWTLHITLAVAESHARAPGPRPDQTPEPSPSPKKFFDDTDTHVTSCGSPQVVRSQISVFILKPECARSAWVRPCAPIATRHRRR